MRYGAGLFWGQGELLAHAIVSFVSARVKPNELLSKQGLNITV